MPKRQVPIARVELSILARHLPTDRPSQRVQRGVTMPADGIT